MRRKSTSIWIGKITGILSNIRITKRVILLVGGFLSTVWILIRVVPKLSHASYPFVEAAAPWASTFAISLLSLAGSVFAFRKLKLSLRASRYPIAGLFMLVAMAFSFLALTTSVEEVHAAGNPLEGVNQPMNIDGGIESAKVLPQVPQVTPDNSGLVSEKVYQLYVDSFNVKWFATDKGINRYNDTAMTWDTINSENYLFNDNAKQIAYQYSNYSKAQEMWVATDSGLTVMSYTVDAITSATTYTKSQFNLLSDTIESVGVDNNGRKWVASANGINSFTDDADISSYTQWFDSDRNPEPISAITIVGMEAFDDTVYTATMGGGVQRYTFNDVDGITGASSYDSEWSGTGTENYHDIEIFGTTQWYATEAGIWKHEGTEVKEGWTHYNMVDSGLPTSNFTAVNIDDEGRIWAGTEMGLFVSTELGWYKYGEDEGIVNPVVNDIITDYSGISWIATDGGVEYFEDVPGVFYLPSIQAKNIIVESVTEESLNLSWTNGSGTSRVVFMKEGEDGAVKPTNSTTYSANAEFGTGDAEGDWYCVFNGTGTSVTVTGLSPETDYVVWVFEYAGTTGAEVYQYSISSDNPIVAGTGPDALPIHQSDALAIYPNPFNNQLNIDLLEANSPVQVSIYSLTGQLLINEEISGKSAVLKTDILDRGSYILVVKDGDKRYSYKVMK